MTSDRPAHGAQVKPRAPHLYPPCEPWLLLQAICETDATTSIRDEADPLEGTLRVRSFQTTANTSASDPHPAVSMTAAPPASQHHEMLSMDHHDNGLLYHCSPTQTTANTSASDPHPAVSMTADPPTSHHHEMLPMDHHDNGLRPARSPVDLHTQCPLADNGLRPERSPASPANLNVREKRSLTTANTSASDPHPAVSMETRKEISAIEWFPVASDLKNVLPFMSRLRKWIKEHKKTLPRANSVPRQQVAKPRARPARVSCPPVAASAARSCVVLNTWYYVTTTLTLSLPRPSGAAAASHKICQITNTKPKGASSGCHARASDSTTARPAATAILPAPPSLATFSRVRVYALNITAPHLSPLPPTPPFALHLNHDPSNDG